MTDQEFQTLIKLVGVDEACEELWNQTINTMNLEKSLKKLNTDQT